MIRLKGDYRRRSQDGGTLSLTDIKVSRCVRIMLLFSALTRIDLGANPRRIIKSLRDRGSMVEQRPFIGILLYRGYLMDTFKKAYVAGSSPAGLT